MMNKRLPLDDFERDVRKLAEGFEIKPRNIVFDNIRYELSGEGSAETAKGGGRIIKTVFSKSLTFISYAAAAAALTVSSVFIPQQHQNNEEINSTQLKKYSSAYRKQLQSELAPADTMLFPAVPNTGSVPQVLPEHTGSVQETIGSDNGVNHPSMLTQLADEKYETGKVQAQASVSTTENRPPIRKQYVQSGKNLKERKPMNRGRKQKTKTMIPAVVTPPAKTGQITQITPEEVNPAKTKAAEADQLAAQEPVYTMDCVDSVIVQGKDSSAASRSFAAAFNKGVWSVAAFYSYDVIKNTYQVDPSRNLAIPFVEDYKSFRNHNTHTSYGYRAGVKLEYSFLNHISLNTGLNYSYTSDRIGIARFYETFYDSLRQQNVERLIISPGYDVVVTNQYHYIEVPLSVSYSNTLYSRFACRVTAGVSYGYLFGTNSYFVSRPPDGQFPTAVYRRTASASAQVPISQSMINLNLGAYVSYLATPKLEIFAGPNLRKGLTSLYKKDYLASQTFTTLGTEAGVRFFF